LSNSKSKSAPSTLEAEIKILKRRIIILANESFDDDQTLPSIEYVLGSPVIERPESLHQAVYKRTCHWSVNKHMEMYHVCFLGYPTNSKQILKHSYYISEHELLSAHDVIGICCSLHKRLLENLANMIGKESREN